MLVLESVVPPVPVSGTLLVPLVVAGSVVPVVSVLLVVGDSDVAGTSVLLAPDVPASPLVAGWQVHSMVSGAPLPMAPALAPVLSLVPEVLLPGVAAVLLSEAPAALLPSVASPLVVGSQVHDMVPMPMPIPAAVVPVVPLAPEVLVLSVTELPLVPVALVASGTVALVAAPDVVSEVPDVPAENAAPLMPSSDTRIAMGNFFMLAPIRFDIRMSSAAPKMVVRQMSTHWFSVSLPASPVCSTSANASVRKFDGAQAQSGSRNHRPDCASEMLRRA